MRKANMLTTSVLDYVGRAVDVLAFDDAKLGGEALLTQALVKPGQSGALITGISKLAQRVLIELLTEKGSLYYDPARGTSLITAFRAGLIQTTQDLQSTFALAELDVRLNLGLEETTEDPDDERYASMELLSVSISQDTVSLSIKVNSLAGDSRVVIYPLRSTPTPSLS